MRNLQDKIGLISWRPKNKFRSELEEDLFVVDYFQHKNGGFVLDIGAADGITASNSFRLINEYEWKALLIEPCVKHLSNLKILYDNVDDVECFYGAVNQEKKLEIFYEVDEHDIGLSNIIGKSHTRNQEYITYEVPCLDINTIIQKHNVPLNIDFVSLDIEGSEQEVLYNWDFSKYNVDLWCVEENEYSYESFFNSKGYERLIVPQKYKVCPYNVFYQRRS